MSSEVAESVAEPANAASSLTQVLQRALGAARQGDLGPLPVIAGLIVIAVYFQLSTDIFLSSRNLSNLVLQVAATATIGFGSAMVLLMAQVDLSAGPLSAVGASTTALLIANYGTASVPALVAGILLGALVGAAVGGIVEGLGVPAFVATLGASLALTGVLLIMLGAGGSVLVQDPVIVGIANNYVPPTVGWVLTLAAAVAYSISAVYTGQRRRRASLAYAGQISLILHCLGVTAALLILTLVLNAYKGIPIVAIIVAILVVGLEYLTRRTKFGRFLYAVGGSAEAARRAGINVKAIRVSVFAIAGALSAFGGIILLSRGASVTTDAGGGDLTLDAIAAAVIGGVSLFGGRGRVWRALLGALVIGSALNGMDLMSVSEGTKYVVIGSILIIAVTLDSISRKQRVAAGRS